MRKEAAEDYLRIIYELYEEKGVKGADIARELEISKASVSEMLRKLAVKKLVKIKPYSKVLLTKQGKKEAEKLCEKHEVIKDFVKFIGSYDDERLLEEVHKLEHSFSEESAEMMRRFLRKPTMPEQFNSYIG